MASHGPWTSQRHKYNLAINGARFTRRNWCNTQPFWHF
jgi:hypothetical protein